jgi:uncharacterized membrane protein (UPF0182 family)
MADEERDTSGYDEAEEPQIGSRTPRRRRPGVSFVVLIFGLVVAYILAANGARFYTEYLWFKEINFTDFFLKRIVLQYGLVAGGFLIGFSILLANVRVAARSKPAYSPVAIGQQSLVDDLRTRYRESLEPYIRRIAALVSLAVAFLLAIGLRHQYEKLLFFLYGEDFGINDPVFSKDAGFYVFRVPFLNLVASYARVLLVLTAILVLLIYWLNGSIEQRAVFAERVTRAARIHVSLLLATLAVVQAFIYYLRRFELLNSEMGVVTGASATDLRARLPAFNLLILISLIVAAILILNVFFRAWMLSVPALVLWIVVQLIGVGVFPDLYQRFAVQPQEFVREQEYISRNIEFTRYAYALSDIKLNSFEPSGGLKYETLLESDPVNVFRLWDPPVTQDILNQLQSLRGYYTFTDVDVDRYEIDGKKRLVFIATREIDQSRLPSMTWVNRHLQFTHGYGVVWTLGDAASEDGRPAFLIQDLPPRITSGLGAPTEELTLTIPQIYYGDRPRETLGGYSIVGTTQPEFDFPQPQGTEAAFRYDGKGGVPLGSLLRRAAFAIRFGDANFVISRQITSESRVIFRNDVRQRVFYAFPHFILDYDPYPVIVDGRIKWVQDAYTYTTNFPYSQKLDAHREDRGPEIITGRLPKNSMFQFVPDTNYVRNSVKAVVDAYDGTVTFYVVDNTDPIIRVFRKAFPSLFKDVSEAPEALTTHFRYPEELFRIQANMFRIYHVTSPRSFYNQEDKWQIPERGTRDGQGQGAQRQQKLPLDPYYTVWRDPEDGTDSFVMIQPFTPQGRPNLLGFMIAGSDGEKYGRLIAYSLPADKLTDGPEQVSARINQDPAISQELTLLDQRGSRVVFGNLLTLPLAGDLLYVQPVFLEPEDTKLPTLQRVIVVYKDRAIMRSCLAAALRDALVGDGRVSECAQGAATPLNLGRQPAPGAAPATGAEAGGLPPGIAGAGAPQPTGVGEALANATRAYEEAQEALRRGDLAEYQRKIDEMKRWVDQARNSLGTSQPG